MALIINQTLNQGNYAIGSISGISWSNVVIRISKSVLSIPYNLPNNTIIKGELMNVYEMTRGPITPGLVGTNIKLILKKGFIGDDELYFSEGDWTNIRDYGILLGSNYSLKVKLLTYNISGTENQIYPKRDVEE